MSKLVKVLLTILIIAVVILAILIISAYVFGYGSLGNLLGHLGNQFSIIWGRIFG